MDISTESADSGAALEELIRAFEGADARWTTARAPGKWSPAQVAEHVARVFDGATDMIEGRPHGFPKMPFFVRPIFRALFLNRTIKSDTFPTARTFKPFDPIDGAASVAAARDRVSAAHGRYLRACAEAARTTGTITSSVFGVVPVGDYMRFTTMHTRHHRQQIPSA